MHSYKRVPKTQALNWFLSTFMIYLWYFKCNHSKLIYKNYRIIKNYIYDGIGGKAPKFIIGLFLKSKPWQLPFNEIHFFYPDHNNALFVICFVCTNSNSHKTPYLSKFHIATYHLYISKWIMKVINLLICEYFGGRSCFYYHIQRIRCYKKWYFCKKGIFFPRLALSSHL